MSGTGARDLYVHNYFAHLCAGAHAGPLPFEWTAAGWGGQLVVWGDLLRGAQWTHSCHNWALVCILRTAQ